MLRSRVLNPVPIAIVTVMTAVLCTLAQAKDITPPKVFLDKSPRIVEYQLKRLDDERLLLVERSTDDPKYIPVYEAIAGRPAIATGIREESLEALAKLKQTSVAAETLGVIAKAEPEDPDSRRLVEQLTRSMLARPADELKSLRDSFVATAEQGDPWLRSIGFAALVTIGQSDEARQIADKDSVSTLAFLGAVRRIPDKTLRVAQRGYVIEKLAASDSQEVKNASMDALSRIPSQQKDTFTRLIALVDDPPSRFSAARSLLRLPADVYQTAESISAAESLVRFAESTNAADRTTDSFIDAMQLAERLMTKMPRDKAKNLRERLREVTVRVVKIGTVEEEMRYDVPYFAAQAGRPLQILLENHDLMPHNLVLTQPGALKGVAMAGLAAGPTGTGGLPYVPDSPNVIAASEMVPAGGSTRITLNAPLEPGEYPYVCTFPQHWYRMYGVMVVVEDLDAWNENPVEPANPIGSNRSFVQAWTVKDFEGAFQNGLEGRSEAIGEKIFNEASCVGCHKMKGVGGAVGPELTDVYPRWKSDHMAILREILDPSHKIDSKYAMQTVLTVDGNTISGIVINENDDTLTIVTDPEQKEPMIMLQDDIELIKRSATSMMPKALMDQFTKDEVLELMGYLKSVGESVGQAESK